MSDEVVSLDNDTQCRLIIRSTLLQNYIIRSLLIL